MHSLRKNLYCLAIAIFALQSAGAHSGAADVRTNDGGQMKFEYDGDSQLRINLQQDGNYMVLKDGEIYMVTNAEGQVMVLSLKQTMSMFGNQADAASPSTVEGKLLSLDSTGRKETIAGIAGEVYDVRFIDNDTVGSYPDGRGGGLYLGASSSVSIFNSVIDGNDADAGAGLYSEAASLHIISSKITSNTASSYGGGVAHIGLTAMSTAQILSTTISGNSALNFDGGVMNSGASTTTISASTIAFNSAAVQGGGIGNYEGGVLAVVNSTISSNEAASGGGIYNESIATLLNSTIVTNGASNGGNIYVDSGGTLELANSIVAMNTLGNDCAGIVSSLGHNIDSDGSCSLLDPDDLPNTNPLLGSLGENGGPTWTHDLTLSSPALDAGDNVCCPAVDQRGVSRPQLGSCDIGAVEYDGQLQFNLPLIQGTYSG